MHWIKCASNSPGNRALSVLCSLAKSIQRAGRTQTEQNALCKRSSDPLRLVGHTALLGFPGLEGKYPQGALLNLNLIFKKFFGTSMSHI